jgi:hypothetical protein
MVPLVHDGTIRFSIKPFLGENAFSNFLSKNLSRQRVKPAISRPIVRLRLGTTLLEYQMEDTPDLVDSGL